MSEETLGQSAESPREGLATQLKQLEAFVARTEQSGEELPPEALEMISRLREIVTALDGLAATLGHPDATPPGEPS
ncbi:MAG: hypothetical protein V4550_06400 [Gemmatimonadota bacterium]